MATTESIVKKLVEQTQAGNMVWREDGWEEADGGAPTYWLTEWYDCQFGAGKYERPSQLVMYSPHTLGAADITEGELVDGLIGVLRLKFDKKRTTQDKMLTFALDRLMNYPRDFRGDRRLHPDA